MCKRPVPGGGISTHDFIATQALGAAAPLCMGVGSKDSVPADFPKKNSGLAPEGLSILAALGPVTRHCGVPQWP